MSTTDSKKLIEVALPLAAVNKASAKEKSIRHGHPSTLHLWWARRPLAAARAVLFAQMVDDPSSHPDLFPTEEDQSRERQRLFRLVEEMVEWKNITDETVLEKAREEIRKSWRRTCEANQDHPQAAELFDPDELPAFHDPFAGGGAIPLEAQRLGLEAHASDLNPVAVLINKAMIEIPPKFAGRPPVNPKDQADCLGDAEERKGATGLASDVRYYGNWMRDKAHERIGHLYPNIKITPEIVHERPDLKPYAERELTVIAWLWARTVKSPNPAFASVDVPLASTFVLSKKKNKEAYVEPVIKNGGYRFTVKAGKPPEAARSGTKLGRGSNFQCLMSGVPMPGKYIKSESMSGRMGSRLMAIVAQGDRERIYITPTPEHESIANESEPKWKPTVDLHGKCRDQLPLYGMKTFADLFTDRQLMALTTFSDLITEARERIQADALTAGMPDNDVPLHDGGTGVTAYAEAVCVYLALALSKQADLGNSLCRWEPAAQCPRQLFGRQAIPMIWDYAEGNPVGESSGSYKVFIDGIVKAFSKAFGTLHASASGSSQQADAGSQVLSRDTVVSTDPPYYDNICYGDLSDFFYIWLRRSLKPQQAQPIFSDLFATLAVPKAEELIASPYRHDSKEKAEIFFLDGMTRAMACIANQAHPAFPVTIYYAFKQSEKRRGKGTASTGWETFLDAVIHAGLSITGTWPISTENKTRLVGMSTNALASSIVLVCRARPANVPMATRRDFLETLKAELPPALVQMQGGNIAPVDLAQAAIGPGMAVFTRYARVLNADGKILSVREALALINQTLDDVLAEQEGELDADTRWALAWFEQWGFDEGDFGVAETLSKAKNTSVSGMMDAGILTSKAGNVRLIPPKELPDDWDPQTPRLTVWESVHHLIRVLQREGEKATAEVRVKLGDYHAIAARELAYRLYRICEHKKRAEEALAYNALVQSWPEITRLANESAKSTQESLLNE